MWNGMMLFDRGLRLVINILPMLQKSLKNFNKKYSRWAKRGGKTESYVMFSQNQEMHKKSEKSNE